MGDFAVRRLIASAAALVAPPALAHHAGGDALAATSLPWLLRWTFEPWLLALLLASAVLYAAGTRRLWRRAGRGRGITVGHALRFTAGWSALLVALVSPIDALGAELFSVHMVQHELLMIVAAPLLVLSRPLEAWTWALNPASRKAFAAIARAGPLQAAWSAFSRPLGAWSLHAIALWAWHAPVLFQAALADEAVHIVQHTCFFVSALFFWWSVFGRAPGRPDGASVASLFTTMMHTSALGALLTFAPLPWYPSYAHTQAFGLSALEDQQLGGLVMWVPGSLAYVAAALAIVGFWVGRGARGPSLR